MAIKLIILGLRRSGTTIFWQVLQQDRRLVGYDEPFNPLLIDLTGSAWPQIKNPVEFERLLEQDAPGFWDRFTPIDTLDELREGLSERQRVYLQFLAETGPRVMFDTTRCHFKLESLAELAPEAVVVHLYRPPAANATSHLLPTSSNRYRTRVRRFLNTRDFWTRRDRFNYWHFESLVGNSPRSLFAERMREIGLDPETVYALPAVAKLMAYWRVNYERVEADGRRLFGERFLSIGFDEFCRRPADHVQAIYSAMRMEPTELDFSRVHPAKPPFAPDDPRWAQYAETLGLPTVQ